MLINKWFIIHQYIQEKFGGNKSGSLLTIALKKCNFNKVVDDERPNEKINQFINF